MKSGISAKLMRPILILIISAIIIPAVFAYIQQYRIINQLMESIGETAVEEIVTQIDNSEKMITLMSNSLKQNYLRITRSVAKMIEVHPNILRTENMIELAKRIGVDELHITDEKGVLTWGSVPGFFGFDFNTTDQTRPFIPMLTNKNFELAQDPEERGTDKVLFSYISVPRHDKPGIVQIGVRPEELQSLVNSTHINTLIKSIQVGNGGFGFITNDKGDIIAHVDDENLGKNLSEFDVQMTDIKADSGIIKTRFNNKEYLSIFTKRNNTIIFANVLRESYTQPLINFLWIMILVVLIIISLTIFIIYALTQKTILKPLSLLCSRLQEIAFGEGDLTQQVNINTGDEFEEVACTFNQFVLKLKNIIIQILNDAEELKNNTDLSNSYSKDLAVISSDLNNETQVASAGTEEISANTNTIANSVETTSVKIEEVKNRSDSMASLMNKVVQEAKKAAENVHEVTQIVYQLESNSVNTQDRINKVVQMINHAANAIDEISSSIQEISQKTNQANQISEKANQQAIDTSVIMDDLKKSATEIGKVIKVINAIADQTNMLALNATIEAASAGDAGKGFAVVANEVKELAKQTSEATEKISSQIDSVQSASMKSSKAIEGISEIIKELFEINQNIKLSIDDQSGTIKGINSSIQDIAENADNINKISNDNTDFSKKASKNSKQANDSVELISKEISNSSVISKQIAGELSDINNRVKDVTRNTSEISIGISEISQTIVNISNSSHDTAKKAEQNNESALTMSNIVKNLKENLSKFKV